MAEDSVIAHGGLYRCCIGTIMELPKEDDAEGVVRGCKHACGGKFRFNGKHWEVQFDPLPEKGIL